jgi:hypothetical protein
LAFSLAPVEAYKVFLRAETKGGVTASLIGSLTVCGSEKLVLKNSTSSTITVFSEEMFKGLWKSYPLESLWSV